MKAHSVFVNLHKYGINPTSFKESSDEQIEDGSVTIDDKLYIQVCAFTPQMFLHRSEKTSNGTIGTKTVASTQTIATLALHIKKELSA